MSADFRYDPLLFFHLAFYHLLYYPEPVLFLSPQSKQLFHHLLLPEW